MGKIHCLTGLMICLFCALGRTALHLDSVIEHLLFDQNRFHEVDYRIAPLTTALFVRWYQAVAKQGHLASPHRVPLQLRFPNHLQTRL